MWSNICLPVIKGANADSEACALFALISLLLLFLPRFILFLAMVDLL